MNVSGDFEQHQIHGLPANSGLNEIFSSETESSTSVDNERRSEIAGTSKNIAQCDKISLKWI